MLHYLLRNKIYSWFFENLAQNKTMTIQKNEVAFNGLKSVLKTIALKDIKADETLNPREVYDVEPLVNDIRVNGLSTPLFVNHRDGKYHLLRGYRRYRALKELSVKEIRCQVFSNLSTEQETLLRLDHSNSKPLETELEIFRTIRFYMGMGKSEREIALLMDGFFANRIKASAIERRQRALAKQDETEKMNSLLSVWKGRLEPYTRATKLPDDMIQRFEQSLAIDSKLPDGERLTKQDVKTLYSAWNKDVETSRQDTSVPEPTKASPGLKYKEAERQLYADKLTQVTEGKKKTSSMRNRKQIEEFKAQFTSELARGIFDWVLGKDVGNLVALEQKLNK
jgi:hypothetical protein